MRLVLKLFLGFFLITGIAAFFVMRVFVNEVKPGVRQAMESTLVDAANVLAEMAAADVKDGTIRSGSFTRNLAKARQRDLKAMVWRFPSDRWITDHHRCQGHRHLRLAGRDLGVTIRAGTMSTAPCVASTALAPARKYQAKRAIR
jgi:hypothetical protein